MSEYMPLGAMVPATHKCIQCEQGERKKSMALLHFMRRGGGGDMDKSLQVDKSPMWCPEYWPPYGTSIPGAPQGSKCGTARKVPDPPPQPKSLRMKAAKTH